MRKYRLIINGISQEEAVELMEQHAGGEVMWATAPGRAEVPSRFKGPLFCYPHDDSCSVEPMDD